MTERKFSLAILISGNGSNLQTIIDRCADGRITATIYCVISNEADAYGLQRARRAGIPTHILPHTACSDRSLYDAKLANLLDGYQVDLIVLAGLMRILGDKFINKYPQRIINLHPSLLPKYKGLDTHARVLKAGDRMHGASVHFVTPELDSGPVIAQASVPVQAGESPEALQKRVLAAEHRLYAETLQRIASGELDLDSF